MSTHSPHHSFGSRPLRAQPSSPFRRPSRQWRHVPCSPRPRYAEVDLCAGFSRWHGPKSLVSVRQALGNCGFDRVTTDGLLRQMKREQASCPHYYQ